MSNRKQNGGDGVNDEAGTGPAPSKAASQLFGHKGGAKPWSKADQAKPRDQVTDQSAPAASAPYPRDAQYAPRPLEEKQSPRNDDLSPIFTSVDDAAELTKLHPNYKLLMRLIALLIGCVLMVVGLVVDGLIEGEQTLLPFGILTGIAVLIGLYIIIRVPLARYNARGYQISRDRLRVVRGVLWHSDTIVPFGRIQHIDVDQGPIERALGIATLTLHTAGSHNASVRLPGLGHELAVEMREEIRSFIKRESM